VIAGFGRVDPTKTRYGQHFSTLRLRLRLSALEHAASWLSAIQPGLAGAKAD
jgi:hypothetical protein